MKPADLEIMAKRVEEIHVTLLGTPENRAAGLVVRVDRIEQRQDRRDKYTFAMIGSVLMLAANAIRGAFKP